MPAPSDQVDDLLSRHEPDIARMTRDLLGVLAEVRPDLVPAVKTGWGSVNYRHPRAGFVCAVFPQARERNVILVFEQGKLLSSPLLKDNGKVKQVRWIELRPGDDIPVDEIAILIAEAIALRA